MQLNRFCASGLEAVNIAAQKVASGWEDLVFAGGVESMSRVPMGSDGGAWAMDPETAYDTSFVPQGIGADLIATVEDFSRDDVDAYATRSQELAATAQSEGRFAKSVVPVLDINDHVLLDRDEFIRPGTTVETLSGLKPSFAAMGEMGGFDAVALQKYHWIEKINHVHTPGNSSGIVDGAAAVADGVQDLLGYPHYARTVYESYRNLFSWIELQKKPIPIILGLITIVATVNIIGTLLMMVLDKTGEIGVLRAMGATRMGITGIFVRQGMIIGLIGTILGNVLAWALCYTQEVFHVISLPSDIYFMSSVPILLRGQDFLLVSSVTLALCFLSSLLPARLAARLRPVNAIRFS